VTRSSLAMGLLLSACGGGSAPADTDPGPGDTDPADDYVPECAPPDASTCREQGSLLRGTVRLPAGFDGPARGDLMVAVTHYRLGDGDYGGVPHYGAVIEDVDLSEGPVEWTFDMCLGGAMWSEENCEYNLVAVLDGGGDNDPYNVLPETGEPSHRQVLAISCEDASPCLDVVLDCVDGPSCVQFSDPGACECAATSCNSDYTTCQ
jgi:hypothetical protein